MNYAYFGPLYRDKQQHVTMSPCFYFFCVLRLLWYSSFIPCLLIIFVPSKDSGRGQHHICNFPLQWSPKERKMKARSCGKTWWWILPRRPHFMASGLSLGIPGSSHAGEYCHQSEILLICRIWKSHDQNSTNQLLLKITPSQAFKVCLWYKWLLSTCRLLVIDLPTYNTKVL